MPVYLVEVPDVTSTVQKQVLDSVITNFLEHTGLSDKDVKFLEPLSNSHQPGSNIGDQTDVSFGNNERITLEFEETRNEETRISRAPGYTFEVPFFLDAANKIRLSPSMVGRDVTLTLSRRAPSRAALTSWLNEFQRKSDMGRSSFVTMSNFFYYVPVPCLNLIAECYRARTTLLDYEDTLKDYMKQHFAEAITVIAGEGGIGETFAVRMQECRILITIEEQEPRPVKGEGTAWTAEVTCKFTYFAPEAVRMSYPIIINNTMLDKIWWHTTEAPGLNDETGAVPNVWVDALDKIIKDLPGIKLPIKVPNVDEPYVGTIGRDRYEQDLVRGYLQFNHESGWVPDVDWKPGDDYPQNIKDIMPVHVCNMAEIPNVEWSKNLLEYMHDCVIKDPTLRNCIIRPIVYEDKIALNRDKLIMDEELNVWSAYVPNLMEIYRFSFSIWLHWRTIDEGMFDELRTHPGFVSDIIKDFFPSLYPKYPSLSKPDIGKLPAKELDDICQDVAEAIDKLQPTNDPNRSNLFIMSNILNGRIITYRGD